MTLDIRTPVSHGDKWECSGCHTWNASEITRCSWCSKPRPKGAPEPADVSDKEAKLTNMIHQAVERMSYPQKAKTWRLLEDNVI